MDARVHWVEQKSQSLRANVEWSWQAEEQGCNQLAENRHFQPRHTDLKITKDSWDRLNLGFSDVTGHRSCSQQQWSEVSPTDSRQLGAGSEDTHTHTLLVKDTPWSLHTCQTYRYTCDVHAGWGAHAVIDSMCSACLLSEERWLFLNTSGVCSCFTAVTFYPPHMKCITQKTLLTWNYT